MVLTEAEPFVNFNLTRCCFWGSAGTMSAAFSSSPASGDCGGIISSSSLCDSDRRASTAGVVSIEPLSSSTANSPDGSPVVARRPCVSLILAFNFADGTVPSGCMSRKRPARSKPASSKLGREGASGGSTHPCSVICFLSLAGSVTAGAGELRVVVINGLDMRLDRVALDVGGMALARPPRVSAHSLALWHDE